MNDESLAMTMAEMERRERWTGIITTAVQGKPFVPAADLWTAVGLPDRRDRTAGCQAWLGLLMRRLGFERRQVRAGGRGRVVIYRRAQGGGANHA